MKLNQTAKRDWGATWFTRGVFDHTAGCSVEVSMNVDITWQSKGTREETHFLKALTSVERVLICYLPGGSVWQSSRSAADLFLRWPDNSRSWWTTRTSQTCQKGEKRLRDCKRLNKKKLDQSLNSVDTSVLPVDLSGLLNGGHSLNLF